MSRETTEAALRAAVLNPGVSRREVWAWAMYDFANSGYTTVILTTVFSTYFVAVVAQSARWPGRPRCRCPIWPSC